jgi:tripartite-type tricarboxylate transporter receptor subunit TctC
MRVITLRAAALSILVMLLVTACEDGFPNQPLTLVVVDDAGSDDGIYARHLQSALNDRSPVRINIADRPDLGSAFGTFEAIRAVAAEPGGTDGYVLVVGTQTGTVLDLIQTPVMEELDITIEDANWVNNNENVPWIIVGRADAPWGNSFEDMIAYCQENPGEVTYVSRGPGASVGTAFLQYMNAAECEVNEVVGGSAEEIAIAVGAGEGDVAISVVGVTLPLIEEGRLVPLACTGNQNPCPGDWETDVPTAGSVVGLDDDPWGSTRGLVVPIEVPDEHRDWLYELFSAAPESEEYQENRSQLPGLTIIDLDHEGAMEFSRNIIDFGWPILEAQGQIDPSVTEPPS